MVGWLGCLCPSLRLCLCGWVGCSWIFANEGPSHGGLSCAIVQPQTLTVELCPSAVGRQRQLDVVLQTHFQQLEKYGQSDVIGLPFRRWAFGTWPSCSLVLGQILCDVAVPAKRCSSNAGAHCSIAMAGAAAAAPSVANVHHVICADVVHRQQ